MNLRIGVDLGGTKIEAIGLDSGGQICARQRIPTPKQDYDGTVRAVAQLVTTVERDIGASGSVGVGIPGSLSPVTGLVRNANSTWLNGRPLADDLTTAVGRPVRVANDADCFALSEATDGAAAGAATVFGVIVGTGVGGGIVVQGRLVSGPNRITGEWGHNPLPAPRPTPLDKAEWPGPPCYCGRTGCIETFLSGPGLAADVYRWTSRDLSPADIVAAADGADPEAEAALRRYEDRMARALAAVINILDPDVIVLGGGLSNLKRLYQAVPRLWSTHVFSDTVATTLLPPLHGDSSGVRGAAWLWNEDVMTA
jgi:fructokinase